MSQKPPLMNDNNIESTGYAIPFEEVINLINCFEYGNKYRVAIEMVALTGCRLAEIDNMGVNSIYGDHIIWKLGKNQKHYRKVKLPEWFLKEICCHLSKNQHCAERLFNFSGKELGRIVRRRARPKLGQAWHAKRPVPQKDGGIVWEYCLQVKGLRHNYATLRFKEYFDKWGGTVAVELTAKELQHSSYRITAGHYVGNFDQLEIEKYKGLSVADILNRGVQSRLPEFF